MRLRKTIAALSLTIVAPLTLVACGTAEGETAATTSTTSTTAGAGTSSTSGSTSSDATRPEGGPGDGGPGGEDPSSVSTEEELVQLIQSAYGEAGLGLHRGHQPIEDVLDTVLEISHDELHVRMEEQGQNLATVAEDLGIDPQVLIDALVDKYAVAVDTLLEDGTITSDEADAYLDALEDAFTYRVTWDGQEATPSFTGL